MRREHWHITILCCLMVSIAAASILTRRIVAFPDQPIVTADPKMSTAAPGEFFTVNVTVTNITQGNSLPAGLFGWQVKITFNPDILNVTDVTEGPFLKQAGNTWFPNPTISNETGFILMGDSLFPMPAEGAYGSGVLASITFLVKTEGQTTLHFDGEVTFLRSYDSSTGFPVPISCSIVDSTFKYPVLRDVAVTGVEALPTSIVAGGTVSINVTVKNEGNVTETFNVRISYDTSVIGTKTVTDLASKESQTVRFDWDTSGLTEGNYTITATATVVPGETETMDNVNSSKVIEVIVSKPTLPIELLIGGIGIIVVTCAGVLFYMKRRSTKT